MRPMKRRWHCGKTWIPSIVWLPLLAFSTRSPKASLIEKTMLSWGEIPARPGVYVYMYMPLYIQINRYGIYEYWNVWILCTCICHQRENHASVLTFFDVHHVSIFEVGVRGWGGNKVRSAFMHVTLHACHVCTGCCTTWTKNVFMHRERYVTCFLHVDPKSG